MKKTIKVIDLLNKIANGEEVPKKIKWEDTIFAYSDYDKDYLEFPFSEEEYKGLFCMKYSILTQYLNDEVEIIEEDKKIEKLFNCCMETDNQEIKFCIQNINDAANKINELIDAVNELKEKE